MANSLILKESVVAAFVVSEGVALMQMQKKKGENKAEVQTEAEAAQTETMQAEAEAQTEVPQTEAILSATTPRTLS